MLALVKLLVAVLCLNIKHKATYIGIDESRTQILSLYAFVPVNRHQGIKTL